MSAKALDGDPSVTFPRAFLPFPLVPDAEGTAPKPDAPSQAEPREEPCVWEQRDPGDREILMDPDTGDGSWEDPRPGQGGGEAPPSRPESDRASLESLVGPVLPPLTWGGHLPCHLQGKISGPERTLGTFVLRATQLWTPREAGQRDKDGALPACGGPVVACSEGP